MIIRKAEPKDAERYLKMLHKMDTETKFMLFEPGERTITELQLKSRIEDFKSTGSLMLLAEKDGEIAGFLSAERGTARRIRHSAYIVIGILQAYAGKGVGTQLFLGLDQWARENGITRLELTVMAHNERAVKLYRKMGFRVEGFKEKSLVVDGMDVDEYYMAKIY